MPSLGSIIGQASRGADLYFVFRFLRLLTMKYTSTDAYKLGIIDKKGKALKKSADLESIKEKAAYTMLHRMVFKIRGLIEKVPLVGKSILLNYAAALFLLKEQKDTRIWTDDGYMKRKLMEFLETDWEADAKFLKEEVDNMEKKSFTSFLSESKDLAESQTLQAMMALDDAGIEAVIDKKGKIVVNKKDLKKAEKALKKSFRKGGEPDLIGEEMDPRDHVEEKDGKFVVVAPSGKIVYTSDDKKDAEDWAIKNHDDLMKESNKEQNEEIANSVGGGNIAGLGVGPQGEPGKPKKKKKKEIEESVIMGTFAGKQVFVVDSDTFHQCRLGKRQYARYEKYVGKDNVGLAIREYGLKFPKRPIILQNGENGPMLYLRYGRS